MKTTNVGDLLKNVGKIRKDIEKIQSDLRHRVVEGEVQGGKIRVLMNGQQELMKVTIEPELVAAGEAGRELLEDLLVAAISQALDKSKKLKNEEMQKATGGLGLNFADLL